jgi:hypothetical protein
LEHVLVTEPLALRLGLGHPRLVGRSIDFVIVVVLSFVVDLIVVEVLARILGVLNVAVLRDCCRCCYSSSFGPLTSRGVLRARSRGSSRGSAGSYSLSLAAMGVPILTPGPGV